MPQTERDGRERLRQQENVDCGCLKLGLYTLTCCFVTDGRAA